MYPPDENKKAFMKERSNFYYQVMPFDLKNAGSTYQRLIDKIFLELLEKTLEVYVDDTIVKSIKADSYAADLKAVFDRIRRHDLRLNLKKCFLGVGGRKFFDFMIMQRGIEVNPDKCETIIHMRSPTCLKEVQQLNGNLVALSRFLPKLAEKAIPCFRLLKRIKTFTWDEACEDMFTNIKRNRSVLHVLASLPSQALLLVYLVVAQSAISSVLVYEDGKR